MQLPYKKEVTLRQGFLVFFTHNQEVYFSQCITTNLGNSEYKGIIQPIACNIRNELHQ
jgi:hypothetical protein